MYIKKIWGTCRTKTIVKNILKAEEEIIFHQSGGCCDGSSPMCLSSKNFRIGTRDLRLGYIEKCKFYMEMDLFKLYKDMHITINTVKGRGASFSLEIPFGLRFITISKFLNAYELPHVRCLF